MPQLVINIVVLAGTAWYLPRALRRHRNRSVVVTVLVLGLIGLWVNLHGNVIGGWQEGFRVAKA